MKQALWKPMIYGGIRPIKAIVMSKKNLRGKKASQHISLFPFLGIITWWVENLCPPNKFFNIGRLTQSETPSFSAPAATFLQLTFLLILAGEQTCHQCCPRENFVKKLHLSTIRFVNQCHQRVLRGRGKNWASVEIGVDVYNTVHIRTKWELIDIRGRSTCNKDKYDRQVCISSLDLVYRSDCDPKEKNPGISYIIFFQVQYWPSDFGGFWTSWVSKLWSLYWPKVPSALIIFIFSHLQNLTALLFFPSSHSGNVTVVSGHLARLNCRVRNLGNRTVSWIRLQDLSLLTVGRYTYTSDLRFDPLFSLFPPWTGLRGSTRSTAPTGSWRWRTLDWLTQVLWARTLSLWRKAQDLTSARCRQAPTWPTWSTSGSEVTWPNLEILSDPVTRLVGGPEMFVESSSMINLTCLVAWTAKPPDKVENSPPRCKITWYQVVWLHNGSEVTYNGARTGVSLIIDKSEVKPTVHLQKIISFIHQLYSRWRRWVFCCKELLCEILEITLAGGKNKIQGVLNSQWARIQYKVISIPAKWHTVVFYL